MSGTERPSEHRPFDFTLPPIPGEPEPTDRMIGCESCCQEWPCLSARLEQAEQRAAGLAVLVDVMRSAEVSAADVLVAIINLRGPGRVHPLDGYTDQEGRPLIVACDQAVSRSKEAMWSDIDASRRAREIGEAFERLADVAQFVFDRITNGVTDDERWAMKDAARIAMESYRAALAGAGGEGGEVTS